MWLTPTNGLSYCGRVQKIYDASVKNDSKPKWAIFERDSSFVDHSALVFLAELRGSEIVWKKKLFVLQ